jgi:hypothetical protein
LGDARSHQATAQNSNFLYFHKMIPFQPQINADYADKT